MSVAWPETLTLGARRAVLAYVGVTVLVVALMMLLGLLLRLSQAQVLVLPPDLFYQVMTAHGIGMVGIAGLGGAAIMWYYLSRYVQLNTAVLVTNLVLFLVGVVFILAAIFAGGFAAAWTFLFPLPAKPLGVWSTGAAAAYLVGVLLVGVGFLLFFLDTAWAILVKYGSLRRALGWPQMFGRDDGKAPPPTVVASTVVSVINILSIVVGAVILTVCLVNLYVPAFAVNALLAKNLIFFFGHVFINAAIYMTVIAVFEILPRYTGRPWPSSRVFLAAWTATMIMVLIVYPHHLLMDFAMPVWTLVMGQIISYTSGLPVLVVTMIGTLAIVYRSGLRWDVVSALLFLSVFGWAAGVLPAIIDATIVVNNVMHNTLWVPGHFHFYLVLGLAAMLFAFAYDLAKSGGGLRSHGLDTLGFWTFAVAGLGLAGTFLLSGRHSIPRRWAVHLPEWLPYDRIGSLFAALVVAAALVFAVRFLMRLGAMARPA